MPPKQRSTRQHRADITIQAPKRQRNRRRQPKRSLFSIFAKPLLAIAVIGALVWGLTDPRLDVRQVEVDGAQTVSPQEIASLVPLPAHENLFLYAFIHHHEIKTRIERAEPPIESAHVGIRPPQTLIVAVAEREPYALLRVGQASNYWELDRNGVVFHEVATPPDGLPCIMLDTGTAPVLGQASDMAADSPVGASYLLLHLLSTDKIATLMKIREITVDQNANLCLNMSNNLQIRLGQPEQLAQKLSLAETALTSDASLADRAAYLDFTYPERPAWKPRTAALSNTPILQNISD